MNFKVMQIVMQRFPPTLRLKKKKKKIASHNWRKNFLKKERNLQIKPGVLSLSRKVVVGQGRSERRSARSKAEESR